MLDTELHNLTIRTFHEGLMAKNFSALEVVQAYFKHIAQIDPEIGAYLSLGEEAAVRDAEKIDLTITKNKEVSPLAGVPLAIKDNILVKYLPATAGSKILQNYIASYDAGAIESLRKEGAVFLGKTNLDEFAMGASTENSGFKVTKNPHDMERVPGGSSGGSAAAVAASMALAGLGSDTFGSVRQPSGFCGVVGLKPTYGSVSRSGLIAMCSSCDQIGTITKTVEDAAILFRAITGKDPLDATSADVEYADDLMNPDSSQIKKLVVGVPKEYFGSGLDKQVESATQEARLGLEKLGVQFKDISLPHTKYVVPSYYTMMPAEVSANLARFDGVRYARNPERGNDILAQRGGGFGPEVKRRIILGTFVLSAGYHDAYYKKAQQVRTLIKRDFVEAFEVVDVIFTPTSPTLPFKIGEKTDDPVAMYLSDVFTGAVNLAGLPAISMPTPRKKGELPVGFQLIGKHFREADILGLGRLYEQSML